MSTPKNPYDYLRINCFLIDSEPIEATASYSLSASANESVTITTAIMPDGYFVYGYVVHWHQGSTSSVRPSAARGLFYSQREARLHAVGFMMAHLDYFLPGTQADIRRAESILAQAELFE